MSSTVHIHDGAAFGREDNPRVEPRARANSLRLCSAEKGERRDRLRLLPPIAELAELVRGRQPASPRRSLQRRWVQALMTGRSAGRRTRNPRFGL
jgi:hypothetical protein